MIKRLLSLLSVVTLLAACNDSEKGDIIAGNTPTNAISFSVFQVEASRAVETTTSTLHQKGIR